MHIYQAAKKSAIYSIERLMVGEPLTDDSRSSSVALASSRALARQTYPSSQSVALPVRSLLEGATGPLHMLCPSSFVLVPALVLRCAESWWVGLHAQPPQVYMAQGWASMDKL